MADVQSDGKETDKLIDNDDSPGTTFQEHGKVDKLIVAEGSPNACTKSNGDHIDEHAEGASDENAAVSEDENNSDQVEQGTNGPAEQENDDSLGDDIGLTDGHRKNCNEGAENEHAISETKDEDEEEPVNSDAVDEKCDVDVSPEDSQEEQMEVDDEENTADTAREETSQSTNEELGTSRADVGEIEDNKLLAADAEDITENEAENAEYADQPSSLKEDAKDEMEDKLLDEPTQESDTEHDEKMEDALLNSPEPEEEKMDTQNMSEEPEIEDKDEEAPQENESASAEAQEGTDFTIEEAHSEESKDAQHEQEKNDANQRVPDEEEETMGIQITAVQSTAEEPSESSNHKESDSSGEIKSSQDSDVKDDSNEAKEDSKEDKTASEKELEIPNQEDDEKAAKLEISDDNETKHVEKEEEENEKVEDKLDDTKTSESDENQKEEDNKKTDDQSEAEKSETSGNKTVATDSKADVAEDKETDQADQAEAKKKEETNMKEEEKQAEKDEKDADKDEKGKDTKVSDKETDTEKKKGEKREGAKKEGSDSEEKSTEELKGYAADTMNEFLDMLGMEQLDEKEKQKVSVSANLIKPKAQDSKDSDASKTPTTPTSSAPTKPTATTDTKAPSSGAGTKQSTTSKPQQQCIVCKKVGKCKYNIVRNGDIKHLCDDSCFKIFRANPTVYLRSLSPQPSPTTSVSAAPQKSCAECHKTSMNQNKQFLTWQGMDFCAEDCLGKFQAAMTANCSFCGTDIPTSTKAKFVIKVGNGLKQFCNNGCMEDFRKRLKLCAFCQKDITNSPDGFMAPVGGTGEFKDFCSQQCLQKLEEKIIKKNENDARNAAGPRTRAATGHATCSVCGKMAPVKHEVNFDAKVHKLCGDPCFAAFRYANKLTMNNCENCGVYNEGTTQQSIQFEGQPRRFCSLACVNSFKATKKKTVPCAWCGSSKSNFDMIERVDANTKKFQLFCSLNCLSLYRVNLQATSNQSVTCDQCRKFVPAQYHLTMSDASVRNFCSYSCVMAFQSQFTQGNRPQPNAAAAAKQQAQPTAQPVRQSPRQAARAKQQEQQKTQVSQNSLPMISNVMSLAPGQATQGQQTGQVRGRVAQNAVVQQNRGQTQVTQTVQQQVIVQPPPPKQVKNKSLLCKPFTQTKATSCRPHTQTKSAQTEGEEPKKQVLVPVPVPFFIPVPMAMYSMPTPYPMPLPVPIPVPCFIPTTRKSADSILKHIKEIQERMPADPFEAELLMMAEAVANADKESSDEDNDDDDTTAVLPELEKVVEDTPAEPEAETPAKETPAVAPTSTTSSNFEGEDMIEMALRMASEMTEPVLDLEDSLNPTPINSGMSVSVNPTPSNFDMEPNDQITTIDTDNDIFSSSRGEVTPPPAPTRGRSGKRSGRWGGRRSKRLKVEEPPAPAPPTPPPPSLTPAPDANMVLKYTYGVNAWKHWVVQKNAQLEKASSSSRSGKLKMFKTDLLQCTADELNYSLCLFVKEVRKPNGEEYNPDSIYYLCLGIQQYLFENGRIDNIFTDFYCEKFTECLNEVLHRFEVRLNAAGQMVCRIEEEHLWESKQLGAHSPHVLLNTLIYFNTKYFMLKTPEDHLRLSFSHIMKHWKKTNVVGTKTPGRSVYLRYYAPMPNGKDSSKRKREELPVYEQAENTENPLRCPVKLYEFYLSKCPESIKNRNDVFYLVPERSCVPDSPVWYSTQSLGAEAMTKMLNRIRLVREIQEAHLHHQPTYIAS